MINFGDVPAGSVLPIMFPSYNAAGASATLTGLAVTDIEIYKGVSMTQRSSDAGYTLIDTDGIDLDSTTGINGFSVDLGDNTDAGFFVAGSFYTVVVSAVTIDGQTVNLIAATFRIVAAESVAGNPKVDLAALGGVAQSATDLKDFADTGYDPATHKVAGVVLVDTLTTYTGNTPQTGDSYALANGASGFVALKAIVDAITAKTTNLPSDPADASVVAGLIAAVQAVVDAITLKTAALPSDPADASVVAGLIAAVQAVVDAITLKTAALPSDPADASDVAGAFSTVNATLATIAGYLDTEIAAIKAKTDTINQAAIIAATDALAADVAAVMAKVTVLPEGVEKNQDLDDWKFLLVSSADHVTPVTGATVTAQRCIDGGAFAACANAVVEIGSGVYAIDLAAADLNGTMIVLKFSASGADVRYQFLKTSG